MRASALKYRILSIAAVLVMAILVLMPLHAFITVWGSSIVGHYTALRLWKEVLLIVCLFAVSYLLLTDKKIRSHTLTRRLVWLILIYGLINIVWGIVAYRHHNVSLKALGYGLIVNLRFLLFFLITWAIALRTSRLNDHWQQLLLWPAIVVVSFGLLQIFLLPHDFLKHFGYNLQTTIPPYETINHNSQYVRILSTLRGANPLGAYLLIPITALTTLMIRGKRDWRYYLFLASSIIVLFFSFSRSAWLGTIISVILVAFLSLQSKIAKQRALILSGIILIFLIGFGLGLRHNARVENVLFHTQTHSAIKTTSDQGHADALKSGLRDLAHQPAGRGTGTAGPASVYNTDHPPRIAENYYIQIGQELGWIGLTTFILINTAVGYLLWNRRSDALALILFGSFIGLCFVNLLSHAWVDDTLAYIWWGLAGIAMVQTTNVKNRNKKAKVSSEKPKS